MNLEKKHIDELRKKHGKIYLITVDDYSCIIRKPNRKDLSFASAVQQAPMQQTETLFNQLWVEGDEVIREDDDLFLAAVAKMGDILKVKEAEIKEL